MRAISSGILALLAVLVLSAPPALAQPAGSYLRTCRDVTVQHGRDLTGLCETGRPGDVRATRLDDFPSCQGDIVNRGGSLQCEPTARPAAPPPTASPAPQPAAPAAPPVGPKPAGPAPVRAAPPASPGLPLRESCANIKLKDGVVSAYCRAHNGRWRAATLDLATCRPGAPILNRDGVLVCEPR